MSCTFETFNGGILKSQQPIPYKYVVHSNKTKDDPNSCYEFLHSHATNNEDKNRCLFIADQRKLQYVIQGLLVNVIKTDIYIIISMFCYVVCRW